jgi:amino acid transporter/mannitol/fructose-specific phosphotransferase system IIA component (Ntr-type)
VHSSAASRIEALQLSHYTRTNGIVLAGSAPSDNSNASLKKTLTLFDVYVISTGAMFSSGFFLLPGLAAAQTGPSVILAYFVAGVLILPAMLSQAELATAMPKAGGSYYFIDRAMGPLMGTIGGIGTWLSLVFKTAFALIGMGAYLAIYVELPIKPLAIGLTVAFTALNIVGAKESSGIQRILVTILLGVLTYFIAQGLFFVVDSKGATAVLSEFDPFFTDGIDGFLATVGLVFVSYAGLTKVASVAEEVQDPDRAIPLGMFLSVVTATFVYCVGVFVMVAVLDPVAFRDDMTPVATAADAFFSWLPAGIGVGLAVAAAIAAFASTGNAGMMSASRYPLAMARDKLMPDTLTDLGRFATPTKAIVATAVLMIVTILFADVATVAKLGSAFQLIIFALINLCVIVMRESNLEYYHPGFRSPLYPWVQIAGLFVPIFLIAEMGWLPAILSVAVILLSIAWYYGYARSRTDRYGAVHHVFERLGRVRDDSVDRELRTIMGEKGLQEEDLYEEVITMSKVIDYDQPTTFAEIVHAVCAEIAEVSEIDPDELADGFLAESSAGLMPLGHGVAAPNMRHHDVSNAMMVLVRSMIGVEVDLSKSYGHLELDQPVHAFIFLVSPDDQLGPHLRSVAQIATSVDAPDFVEKWLECEKPTEMRRLLLRDERFLQLTVERDGKSAGLVGAGLAELDFPPGALIALVRREGEAFVPTTAFKVEDGDHLTIIGNPDAVMKLRGRFESL